MNAPVLIRLEKLSKVFTTDAVITHALLEIDLEVSRGEYVAISGPSGCGKSTLLSILGLLDVPSSGSYILNGRSVHTLSGAARSRIRNNDIGVIFQSFNLISDLTVYQNVELPLIYRGIGRKERHRRVDAALARVGVEQRSRHYPSQLSGGQQQRAAVARAIVGEPAIILADEPTGNLDSTNGMAVMELLGELHAGGSTICMVTHDPRFLCYAARTVALLDGRVISDHDKQGAELKLAPAGTVCRWVAP